MADMIESAARAIYEKAWAGAPLYKWDGCNEQFKEDHRRVARTAIEAIREPTEKMITAALEPRGEADNPEARQAFVAQWKRAITAALGKKP